MSNPNESTAGAAGVVDGVARQAAGDVRRMLNERANALAYGNTDRVEKIERDLKEMGFTGDLTVPTDKGQLPVGRSSGRPDVTSPVVTTPATSSSSAPTVTTSKATAGS